MAMGGSAKGNNSKGRSYAVMFLLAFGAALFGVMLLQKFRERRIFNLLVREKDRELFSLQLLLQKERDYTKELKRRTVEMKGKMYSLGTEKMHVDSRILEMQSTIASLQDEQKAMKSGLEEKQNEINLLTEKQIELSRENPQEIALTEILKQKEAEIQDLKHRVELPVKVWSVSSDDSSNPSGNLTEIGITALTSKSEGSERKESWGGSESANNNSGNSTESEGRSEDDKEGRNSKRVRDRNEDRNEDADRRGMTEEKLQKPEHSRHNSFRNGVEAEKSINEGIGKKNEDDRSEGGSGVQDEKSNTNATEATDRNIKKATIDKEDETVRERQREKLKFSRENEGQESGTFSGGVVNLKMADSSQNSANFKVRGRHGYLSNTKGKRWRMIAKNRRLEHNANFALTGTANIRSSRISQAEEGSERLKALTEDHLERSNGHHNRSTNSILNVDLIQEKDKFDISEKWKQGESLRLKKSEHNDVDGREEDYGSKDRSIVNGEASNITGDARKHKPEDGLEETMEQERSGSHNSSDIDKVEGNAVRAKVANVHEEPDESEVADNHDLDANAADGDIIVGSGSEIEDDREAYKEETDESEF